MMVNASRCGRLLLTCAALAVLLGALARPAGAQRQARSNTRTNVNQSAGTTSRGANAQSASANRGANAQSANANRGANAQSANANRNTNVNANRNVNVNNSNNVNVNRNVNVDVDDNWDNDGWDHHPVAAGVAFGTAAAITSAAIGSVAYTLPPSCSTMVVNGIAYQQCGGTWYQPQYAGSQVTYVVIPGPP